LATNALQINTFNDLITLALKNAGIIGVGQTAGASDMTDAAQMLNAMLGQWQRRRYLVYHLVEQSATATGAQSYSLGPGGDFSMSSRPAEINYAFARQVIDSNPNQIDYPLAILPARETYANVAMKSLQAFPQWCWYDAAYPLGQIFVYPVITSQFTIYIGYAEILQTVSSLSDTINLPPEYAQALLYNLAVMLAGAYQLQPNPVVVGLAKAALETMRTVNAQIPQMKMPRLLNGGARWNVFSDRAGPGNY
jgi:hypothetical protein